ncbi:putative bifunctional diguanylate cyclase/phosphodiesterase [Amorphus orientalis]|uniref:Diguanylate cyclase (GGDEF)-like protein n=1 Tax=Amorphus orientalis TaxID=649198 RepID=A0AAE3VK02_9HYPH|nr:bifunctional diguanylate cyclase/phosphodiesterase [Amorphus orientalis]MDQ0313594.1 diguanylate cyclase (GGDEF)-like protein [Amorphus orientalis]
MTHAKGDLADAPKELGELESVAAVLRSVLGGAGAGIALAAEGRVWVGVNADNPQVAGKIEAALVLKPEAPEEAAADGSLLVSDMQLTDEGASVRIAVDGDAEDAGNSLERALPSIGALVRQVVGKVQEIGALQRTVSVMTRFETMSRTGRWQLDLDSRALTWSDEVYRIFDLKPGDPISLERALSFYPKEAQANLRGKFEEAMQTGAGFTLAMPAETASGTRKFVRVMAEPEQVDGGTASLFGVIQDVTEEKEAERRLWWTANHDPLTGLPNRMLFQDRLSRAIEHAKRFDEEIGLVIFDVDNFKMVNDVYGHEAGDLLLKHISDVLLDTIRATDSIARLGGDEFAVILGDLRGEGDVYPPLERLSQATDFKFDYRGTVIPVRMSMGVALFPTHGESGEDLYRNADIALFRTKNNHDRRMTLYESRFGYELQARDELLRDVRQALEADLIVPFYQPLFDLETGAIVGAEVLARWRRAEGTLEAASFIAAINDYETAPLVGAGILRQAAADMAAYKAEFSDSVPFSLNVSRSQVRNPEFVALVAASLNDDEIGFSDFILEISEDAVVERDHFQVADSLADLAEKGLGFAFDDFGNSFSSLIHINSYSVRQVKIDRKLVDDINIDSQKLAIVDGILRICSSLGIDVVAECVEREDQVRALRQLGVRHAQGNFLARPMTFSDFIDLNRSGLRSGYEVSPHLLSHTGKPANPSC